MKEQLAKMLRGPIRVFNRLTTKRYYRGHRTRPSALPFHRKILVLSPHVDDETIGMGATLVQYAKAKSHITLLYLTDSGGSMSNLPSDQVIKTRSDEAAALCQTIGGDITRLELGLPDAAPFPEGALEALKSAVSPEDYDAVFFPYLFDAHPVHMEVIKLVSSWMEPGPDYYMYEGNTPIHPHFIDAVSPMDDKLLKKRADLFDTFKSQPLFDFDVFQMLSLEKATLYPKAQALEVFATTTPDQLRQGLERLDALAYNPKDFPRIGNHRSMYKVFWKNQEKRREVEKAIGEVYGDENNPSS